jgi:hypothetical protein
MDGQKGEKCRRTESDLPLDEIAGNEVQEPDVEDSEHGIGKPDDEFGLADLSSEIDEHETERSRADPFFVPPKAIESRDRRPILIHRKDFVDPQVLSTEVVHPQQRCKEDNRSKGQPWGDARP